MHMAILVIENHSIKYQDDPPKRRGEGKSRGGEKKKERVTSWWVHFTADQSYK